MYAIRHLRPMIAFLTVCCGISEAYHSTATPFLAPIAFFGCLLVPVFPIVVFTMGNIPETPPRARGYAVAASVCLSMIQIVGMLPAVQ